MLVRRTDAGLKYALSNTTRRVADVTSECGTAHDAGDRLRAVAVGDDEHVRVERPLDAVERRDRFARSCPADANLGAGERREVERVHRLAELDEHVVRDVDDRADRTDTGRLQARRHPRRGRPDGHVGHGGGVPRAELVVFDRDASDASDAPVGSAARAIVAFGAAGRLRERQVVRRRHLARQPDHAQAVGPVGGDLEVDDGVVRRRAASTDATSNPRSAERLGDVVGRGADVDEFTQPGNEESHTEI